MNNFKPRNLFQFRKPPAPPKPPAAKYCPRCERQVTLTPHRPQDDIYDCVTCETIYFGHEVDAYPGQTHGKPKEMIHE
jgi:hypothetical protein